MCNMRFIEFDAQSKLNDIDEDIRKHSDDLKLYLDILKDTLLNEAIKVNHEIYKEQINTFYKEFKPKNINSENNAASTNIIRPTNPVAASQKVINDAKKQPIQQQFIPYQCLLGIIEVLMEYYFNLNEFGYIRYLFIKFVKNIN